MIRLVRTEFLKVRTTWTVWGLLAATIVFAGVGVAQSIFAFPGQAPLSSAPVIHNVFASAGRGTIFVLVLGILGIASEYRHQTITNGFLVTPKRGRLIAAKLIAYALLGLTFAVAAAALVVVMALPILSAKGVPLSVLGEHDVGIVLLGALLATAIYAVVGLGVGALIRNQLAAILVALVWSFIVEQLLVFFVPEVGKWLPGNAAAALLQVTIPTGPNSTVSLLSAWAGGLLFLGYGLAFALAASLTTVRRDIT